ncbi:MAG: hypothetical protein BVN32_12550 [Proteobacteria bacterium ST_bin14]|nr:MAG: hypothetical protein BVN32_12550 [Proteobacteria bacterium ST_bin14]
MRIITNPSNLDDPHLRNLLQRRFEQLAEYDGPVSDLARFHVVEPGDDVTEIMTNLVDGSRYGEPEFEPSWEFVERHSCGFFEAVFILDDSGFAHVYFIPDRHGIDSDLLTLCRAYANKAEGTEPS